MFIPALVLAVLAGWVRGGCLARLAEVRFRLGWLVLLAFLIRFALYAGVPWVEPGSPANVGLQALAHGLLLAGLLANRALPGIRLAAAGVLANGLVVLANGGRMPVSRAALALSGQEHLLPRLADGQLLTHRLLDGSTRLPWLADVFALPAGWPLALAFSLGDVLVAVGVFLFVQHGMGVGSRVRAVLQ